MNIDYLRTFLTLAENGSFSETAKEHIVVQSTAVSYTHLKRSSSIAGKKLIT